jgi:hypothetical protein
MILRKGKQSIVYDFGKTVMRVSKRMRNYEILHRASKADIHPHIYGIYECGELTYFQMDKLTEPFVATEHGNQMVSQEYQVISGNLLEAAEEYISQQTCCTALKAHGLSEAIKQYSKFVCIQAGES